MPYGQQYCLSANGPIHLGSDFSSLGLAILLGLDLEPSCLKSLLDLLIETWLLKVLQKSYQIQKKILSLVVSCTFSIFSSLCSIACLGPYLSCNSFQKDGTCVGLVTQILLVGQH